MPDGAGSVLGAISGIVRFKMVLHGGQRSAEAGRERSLFLRVRTNIEMPGRLMRSISDCFKRGPGISDS